MRSLDQFHQVVNIFFLFTASITRIESLNNMYLICWIFFKFLLFNSKYKHIKYKQISSLYIHFIHCILLEVSTAQNNNWLIHNFINSFLDQISWIYDKSVLTDTVIKPLFKQGCGRTNRKRGYTSLHNKGPGGLFRHIFWVAKYLFWKSLSSQVQVSFSIHFCKNNSCA